MTTPEFTGERFVPGQGGAQIAYEHLHRYLFAARWAAEKNVLDVASGTGYGAALLSHVARRVWAIELDKPSITYAHSAWAKENLMFLRSDVTRLPIQTACIDVVVAMEIVEHIEDQDALLREIARVMRPEGLAIVSTPNKATYSDSRNYSNPFHVRELYRDELLALLGRHFAGVRLMTQQLRAGSLILAEDASDQGAEIIAHHAPQTERVPTCPMYFVALCAKDRSFESAPSASAYLDPTDLLSEEWLREAARLNQEIESLGRWGRELDETIGKKDAEISSCYEALAKLRVEFEERGRWAQRLVEEIARRDADIARRDEEMAKLREEFDERAQWAKRLDAEVAQRDEALAKLQHEFQERSHWASVLQAEVAESDKRYGQTMVELRRVSEHLARIQDSFLYRILRRLGILPK